MIGVAEEIGDRKRYTSSFVPFWVTSTLVRQDKPLSRDHRWVALQYVRVRCRWIATVAISTTTRTLISADASGIALALTCCGRNPWPIEDDEVPTDLNLSYYLQRGSIHSFPVRTVAR